MSDGACTVAPSLTLRVTSRAFARSPPSFSASAPLGLWAFAQDPGRWALAAGFGYGLMYFPMWGIVAGWVNRHYSSTATMQISGICMVTFGLGGALGNLLTGYVRDTTGSLESVFFALAGISSLLVLLALLILRGDKASLAPPTAAGTC